MAIGLRYIPLDPIPCYISGQAAWNVLKGSSGEVTRESEDERAQYTTSKIQADSI